MAVRLVKENYNAEDVTYFRVTYKPSADAKYYNTNLVKVSSAEEASAKLKELKPEAELIGASPCFNGPELDSYIERGMPILDEAYIVKPEVDLFDDEENQSSYNYGSSDAGDDWCECNDCGWFGESDELVNGEICPDCGCADIIREPMNESKKAIKESTKAGGRFTINFGHWIQAKSFPTQIDLLKFLRSHVISSSSIITLAKNVTDDYMKSTWYDTAENVQKFNLTSEQRHEIFEKGYTKINQNVSEQMQRTPEEDGWPGIVKDITDKVLSRASTIKYEIDNCVRGAYISGTTIDDLIKSLRYLKNDLIDAIDQLQADARHINESIDCETIEDIDNFISDVKSRFPGSEAIYDGDTHSIKITLDNVCESIKNNSVTESTLSISDLKAFYNTSDSIDKNKYPNFFVWYDDMVRSGRYKNESLIESDCKFEEDYWTVKPDWDDYCPHCCNRSLVGAGDGRAVCDSCGEEYNIEPMPNGRVKITELEESLTESKQAVKNILQPLVTNGRVRAFKSDEKCPRGFAFKSGNGSSGQVSYNGKDYVYAVVDGELRVMTDAEAGSNWSETIYAKESLTVDDTLKIERDIANLMSESGLDVDYVDCFATRSEAIKLNIKTDNIESVKDLVNSYCENNCLTILSEFNGAFGNIVYTLSKESADNESIDNIITEDITVGDTVKVNTPGNTYYDGRTGIVDYIDDRVATVLFDDGNFPKMNNFDITQISRIKD